MRRLRPHFLGATIRFVGRAAFRLADRLEAAAEWCYRQDGMLLSSAPRTDPRTGKVGRP